MDLLHFFYAYIDCRIQVVKFHFPNESILEWKGVIISQGVNLSDVLRIER